MSRTKLTDRKSIPAVIREMTLEEKISLLAASSACRTTEIAELGIPAIRLYDGATGVNFTEHVVDYVNSHDPEEIARVIAPQFAETDLDTVTAIVARYHGQETWKADLIFTQDSYDLLLHILQEAGELTDSPPYEKLVNTAYAAEAAK